MSIVTCMLSMMRVFRILQSISVTYGSLLQCYSFCCYFCNKYTGKLK